MFLFSFWLRAARENLSDAEILIDVRKLSGRKCRSELQIAVSIIEDIHKLRKVLKSEHKIASYRVSRFVCWLISNNYRVECEAKRKNTEIFNLFLSANSLIPFQKTKSRSLQVDSKRARSFGSLLMIRLAETPDLKRLKSIYDSGAR
jgi:hypothetical protein